MLSISPALAEIVRSATSLLLIGFVAFLLLQAIDAATKLVLLRHRIDIDDNLQARAVYTQVGVLKKVAVTVVAVFTLAAMLMVFEPVRQFGASILASAGVAGLVVGFAAQKSIATLLAGFQIALTQPIRVDDVVIVEGEWGRIEDITLTYVVVNIWDLRRLVVSIWKNRHSTSAHGCAWRATVKRRACATLRTPPRFRPCGSSALESLLRWRDPAARIAGRGPFPDPYRRRVFGVF